MLRSCALSTADSDGCGESLFQRAPEASSLAWLVHSASCGRSGGTLAKCVNACRVPEGPGPSYGSLRRGGDAELSRKCQKCETDGKCAIGSEVTRGRLVRMRTVDGPDATSRSASPHCRASPDGRWLGTRLCHKPPVPVSKARVTRPLLREVRRLWPSEPRRDPCTTSDSGI